MNSKNILSVSAIIIALSVAYYLVFYIPQQNRDKVEQKQLEIEQKQQDKENTRLSLDTCLYDVDKSVRADMLEECAAFAKIKNSLPNTKFIDISQDCSFPADELEEFNKRYEKNKQEGKDECFKKYPQ